jgi:hypothetical protein
VGLGTFLAQLFLRRPLMEASTREFLVQGSWDAPKVVRLERKSGDRIPDLDPSRAVVAPPADAAAGDGPAPEAPAVPATVPPVPPSLPPLPPVPPPVEPTGSIAPPASSVRAADAPAS